MSGDDSLLLIAGKSESVWRAVKRPDPARFFDRVAPDQQELLAGYLIPLDIQSGAEAGELIAADDYLPPGSR